MTKKIELSKQRRINGVNRGLCALVDDDDYQWLNQWNWSAISTRRGNGGYAVRNEAGTSILMHRLIVGVTRGQEIDHINGNGLDNRRANLRIASRSTNMLNRQWRRPGTRGVGQDNRDKWVCSIRLKFDKQEDAIAARCAGMKAIIDAGLVTL